MLLTARRAANVTTSVLL